MIRFDERWRGKYGFEEECVDSKLSSDPAMYFRRYVQKRALWLSPDGRPGLEMCLEKNVLVITEGIG